MAALLGTYSALSATRPIRIEGHTSNIENPVYFKQYIKCTIAETTEAGDTYIVPHKFDSVNFINVQPLTAVAAGAAVNGVDATTGLWFADSATISGPTVFTTAATAGASTCVLVSITTNANDHYNGCWLEIRYPSGNKQIVQITDYTHTGTIATLAEPLTEAIPASAGCSYVVKGTLYTVPSVAATPTLAFEVTGTFN